MGLLTEIRRQIRSLTRSQSRAHAPAGSRQATISTVREAGDLLAAAAALSRRGAAGYQDTLRRLRELYEIATPALYIHVTTHGEPCRIVLVPWDHGQVSFSGRGWHLLAGAEATTGFEAFIVPRGLRSPLLYSNAPDHPLFVVDVAHAGQREFRGHFPPYVTHVTIVADGHEVVSLCRLSHEKGACVFRVGRAA